MKKWVLGGLVGLSTLLYGCQTTQRGEDFYINRIASTQPIEMKLNTILKTVNQTDKNDPFESKWSGKGFVFGNYLLTLDHVVSKYSQTYGSPFGPMKIELDRVSESTYIDNIKLHSVIERQETDVAIFDLSKTPKLCEKYCNNLSLEDLMTEEDLHIGMRLFWNGSPQNINGYYGETFIRKLRDKNIKVSTRDAIDSFSIGDSFVNGSSGSPMWHYDKETHKNKIVGVVQFNWFGIGGVKFMDEYIQEIQKYENNRETSKKE